MFLSAVFLSVFLLGRLLEKIRIPWIFAALLIGLGLAAYNPFRSVTSSPEFLFLAELGIYFLLFIIGFELDFQRMRQQGVYILKATTVIILSETFFGSLLLHFVFDVPWPIAILVATSFATVGEAVLLPILDEFRLVQTRLGQIILGIGVLDDVVEIITIVVASFFISNAVGISQSSIWFDILILSLLFGFVFLAFKFQRSINSVTFKDIPSLFLFVIFCLFIFIGVGKFIDAAALGALLAGIAVRNIIPQEKLKTIDSEIRAIAYGFFAPLFFLSVGIETDVGYLIQFPWLVLLVMAVVKTTKITSSYIVGRKLLGYKKSIILGISLSVKFSSSIIVIKLLFDKGLIHSDLFSVLVGAKIAFKFVVPLLLAYLIPRWKIGSPEVQNP